MSKQANKTLIGGFVVGAIAILILAIVAFASLDFFTPHHNYIIYFKGSVYGLSVGSPVTFRGVEIGEVTDILMQFDASDMSIRIPVIIEMGGAQVQITDKSGRESRVAGYRGNHQKMIADMIKRGLRAQLGMQSFVTGQLMVTLEFFPESRAEFVGMDDDYPEIPTVPTTAQMLQETIRNLPFRQITDSVLTTLQEIERILKSPELAETTRRINVVLGDIDRLVNHVDGKVDPLASAVEASAVDTRQTLADARKTISTARRAMENANTMISGMQDEVEGVSEMQYEFTTAMREFSSAAASFRVFIDYLERHPEMMLRGKQVEEE